jgi:hypothetical protein
VWDLWWTEWHWGRFPCDSHNFTNAPYPEACGKSDPWAQPHRKLSVSKIDSPIFEPGSSSIKVRSVISVVSWKDFDYTPKSRVVTKKILRFPALGSGASHWKGTGGSLLKVQEAGTWRRPLACNSWTDQRTGVALALLSVVFGRYPFRVPIGLVFIIRSTEVFVDILSLSNWILWFYLD